MFNSSNTATTDLPTTPATSRFSRSCGSARCDMATLTPAASVRWSGHVAATLPELAALRNRLATALERCGWNEEDAFRVLVCADEAAANALTHGSRPGSAIGAAFKVGPCGATVLIVDDCASGEPIPDAPSTPDEVSEHGRGLILMRALSDRMRIRHRPGRTSVALKFSLDRADVTGDVR